MCVGRTWAYAWETEQGCNSFSCLLCMLILLYINLNFFKKLHEKGGNYNNIQDKFDQVENLSVVIMLIVVFFLFCQKGQLYKMPVQVHTFTYTLNCAGHVINLTVQDMYHNCSIDCISSFSCITTLSWWNKISDLFLHILIVPGCNFYVAAQIYCLFVEFARNAGWC